MIKVSIRKNNVETHAGYFPSNEEADAWIAEHNSKGSWGQTDKFEAQLVEVSPAVYGEEGELIQEAQFEEQQVQVAWQDYSIVIEDISAQLAAEQAKQDKILAGQKAREACQKVLDYVAGENLSKELSIEQITQLQSTFANAEAALRAGRPTFAKQFIAAIQPDGVLVSAEMKAACLSILADY